MLKSMDLYSDLSTDLKSVTTVSWVEDVTGRSDSRKLMENVGPSWYLNAGCKFADARTKENGKKETDGRKSVSK